MLEIRNDQLALFESAAAAGLERELTEGLRRSHPNETAAMQDAELHQTVADGVVRAGSYGLRLKADVALFVELMLTFGRDFDRYPPVSFLLHHPTIPPNEKLGRVLGRMTERDWEDVRRRARGFAVAE
jgi:hypothetical protein